MTPQRLLSLLLGLVLGAAVSACAAAPGRSPSVEASPGPASLSASPSASAAAFPLSVTDDAGREITIEAEPQRIVSLAPSNTEIVCALRACDRLVGVPEYREGYAPEVLDAIDELPVVVTFGPIDREQVVATEPDLVLAAGNELTPSDDITALEELGLDVLVLYPEDLDEVADDVRLVGDAIAATEEAADVVADMERRIDAVTALVADAPRPRTFYEVSIFEGSIYTAGEGSFLASLIELAGGEPITGDAVTTAISLEELVAADPELILLGDATYDPSVTPDSVAQRPGWAEMTAVREGQVIVVTEDVLITRPGPRIVDGLEALARRIHPDRFDGAGG